MSDVLIVGAGPSGLAAAWRVAASGLHVTVVDDNPTAGGQIWRGEIVGAALRGRPFAEFHDRPFAEFHEGAATEGSPYKWFERIRSVDIQMINGARVFQQPEAGVLLAEVSDGVRELKYRSLVLATGARERFLPFPGWTLPNVMGAGGLQALVKTGLPIEGKRVVVAGSGPLLLAVAAYLRKRGAEVLLIAEQASRVKLARFGIGLVGSGKVTQAWGLKKEFSRGGAAAQRVKYLSGCWVVEAHGKDKLESITLVRGGKRWDIACDYLACGFHLVPNLELAELLGCVIENGSVKVDQFQQTTVSNIYSAGEATGIGGLELSLVEGEIAGLAVAGKHDEARRLFLTRDKHQRFAKLLNRTFALREELKQLAQPETIVCRCEDVTFERLSSHRSWREAKLQTRCGMGPCQGRVCGGAVEFLFGWRAESVRPPALPVRVESLIRHNS